MKSQTLFLALAALSSVFAAPIQERSPRRTSTVTVVGKVVEVVHITSTVWVPANNAAPATSTAEPTEAAEPAVTAEPEPEVKEPEYVPEVPAPAPPVEEEEQQEVVEQQPVETTTSTPTPTPSPAPAPVPSPAPPMEEEKPVEQPVDGPENESTGDDSSSSSAFEGEGTFYTPGMGSCGETNSDGDSIVAISKDLMAEKDTGNPNTNPLCGQKIKLWGKNSEPVTVTVTDKCMGCAKNDIDMTPTVFAAIGYEESEGRMPVKWEWA